MSAAAARSRIMHEPVFVNHHTQNPRLRAGSGRGLYSHTFMIPTKEKLSV